FVTMVKGKSASAIYLSVYDKKRFLANMPLLISNNDEIVNSASIDKKLTIVLNKEWIEKDVLYYNRVIYAYNNVGIFTTVLTETNVAQNTGATVINPLDTFPKRYKYSGDYVKGSKNFVSIRDGKTADSYLIFVHFESDDKNESCG